MLRWIKKLMRNQHVHQVRVAFYRLDPETNKLAIYNNLERRIKEFDLLILNTDGAEYRMHVDSLRAQDGIIMSLNNLKDKNGSAFFGEIKKIKAFTSSGIERFVKQGNYFKRY